MGSRFNKIRNFALLITIIVVFFVSVGYSALSASLSISGSTKYNLKKNIRITNVTLQSSTGGGVEYYSPSYTWNSINIGTNFTSSGTVVYQVEITNYSEEYYNISYSISSNNTYTATENYTNPVGNGVYTLTITVEGTSGNDSLIGNFSFEINSSSNLLYDVLKNAATDGTYARRYNGLHSDSLDLNLVNENIYYWYGSNASNGTAILNKNNVLFAGFCWQMIRTTDTGGVKLIYNGVPSNGTCNNTGASSQIGTSSFNSNYNSISDVGYMYNSRLTSSTHELDIQSTELYESINLLGYKEYYYGTGISYDSSTGLYTLLDYVYDTWDNLNHAPNTYYRCGDSPSCESPMFIVGEASSTATMSTYIIYLENGNLLDTSIVLGTGYSNSTTYTLTNTITVPLRNWYTNYSSYVGYYICNNNSSTCTDAPKYIVETYNGGYDAQLASGAYYFGSSYTTSNNIKYFLQDAISLWNASSSANASSLSAHHYTCLSTTQSCNGAIRYVYQTSEDILYYISISDNNGVTTAINNSLNASNVNTNNSAIKSTIDAWYEANLDGYQNYLDDVIYCNDRTISNSSTNGFNPDGGSTTNPVVFSELNYLSCSGLYDRFSVSNNGAKLNYKIGLLTQDEVSLLGNSNVYNTGATYWLLSPSSYDKGISRVSLINSAGEISSGNVSNSYGVRPAITLVSGTEFSSGNGSKLNPYVVDATPDEPEVPTYGTLTYVKNSMISDISIYDVTNSQALATPVPDCQGSKLNMICTYEYELETGNNYRIDSTSVSLDSITYVTGFTLTKDNGSPITYTGSTFNCDFSSAILSNISFETVYEGTSELIVLNSSNCGQSMKLYLDNVELSSRACTSTDYNNYSIESSDYDNYSCYTVDKGETIAFFSDSINVRTGDITTYCINSFIYKSVLQNGTTNVGGLFTPYNDRYLLYSFTCAPLGNCTY